MSRWTTAKKVEGVRRITLHECPACRQDHEKLLVRPPKPYDELPEDTTVSHVAKCPESGQMLHFDGSVRVTIEEHSDGPDVLHVNGEHVLTFPRDDATDAEDDDD